MFGLGVQRKTVYILFTLVGISAGVLTFLVVLTFSGRAPGVYSTGDPAEVPVMSGGECLSVTQDRETLPQVNRVPCQTAASVYRVIDRVGESAKCANDSDAQYKLQETFLCLDYDWDRTNCIAIYSERPFKEQCGHSAQSFRPEMIVVGGSDVSYCKARGISHPVRKYTVCLTDK